MFLVQLRRLVLQVMFAAILAAMPNVAGGQSIDPFEHGWRLDPEASELRFLSIKKSSVAESSSFATLSGLITESGEARVSVLMDSVDTKIDLRNVRMRFLFFETFQFPEATITAQLDADLLRDLHGKRRKMIDLPYTLAIHGVSVSLTSRVGVTLIANDRVAISSTTPIALATKDFNLEEGRAKLQEAANVDILPFGMVSFDFVFDRVKPGTPPPSMATAVATPGAGALETTGDFDLAACVGRFEILSAANSIVFRPTSSRLDRNSDAFMENIFDIVHRCPDLNIQVSGHTDSDGSEASNQRLSEARAAAVAKYLVTNGIAAARIKTVGFGESQPLVPNNSSDNKRRNRRIEFTVLGG